MIVIGKTMNGGMKMSNEEMIHQREYYVAKVLSPQALKERWELIRYEPKPIQLKLF